MIGNPKLRANRLLPSQVKNSLKGVLEHIDRFRRTMPPQSRSKNEELSFLYDYADALVCRLRYLR